MRVLYCAVHRVAGSSEVVYHRLKEMKRLAKKNILVFLSYPHLYTTNGLIGTSLSSLILHIVYCLSMHLYVCSEQKVFAPWVVCHENSFTVCVHKVH